MANITEVSQWESVIRQLENGEAATGGADGLANVQAKQLANRTKWLKENYLPLAGGALTGNALTWNGNDLAGSAIVAKSLIGDTGYVKYASGFTIQWGRRDGTTLERITFPITFKSIGTAVVSPGQSSQESRTAWVGDLTLDSFTIRQDKDGGGLWIAIGIC